MSRVKRLKVFTGWSTGDRGPSIPLYTHGGQGCSYYIIRGCVFLIENMRAWGCLQASLSETLLYYIAEQ